MISELGTCQYCLNWENSVCKVSGMKSLPEAPGCYGWDLEWSRVPHHLFSAMNAYLHHRQLMISGKLQKETPEETRQKELNQFLKKVLSEYSGNRLILSAVNHIRHQRASPQLAELIKNRLIPAEDRSTGTLITLVNFLSEAPADSVGLNNRPEHG